MSNVKEMTKDQIKAQFEDLFRTLTLENPAPDEWPQADIVFRNGQASGNFSDVEFLMASDRNGGSLLYTSQQQGSSIYSVISGGARVSFSCR